MQWHRPRPNRSLPSPLRGRACAAAIAVLLVASAPALAQLPVPAGLSPGDAYQLLFRTALPRDGASSDIDDYNAWVQEQANVAGIGISVSWKALGSTADVDARDNALVQAPVYNTRPATAGGPQRLADGFDDLWDGALDAQAIYTETGDENTGDVWSGSDVDGTAAADGQTLGNQNNGPDPANNVAWCGRPPAEDPATWFHFILPTQTAELGVYALSEVLTVPQPPELTLDRVGDLHPTGNSSPSGMTAFGDHLYFSADDGSSGQELWRTRWDPEADVAITNQVVDLHPSGSSSPGSLTPFEGFLYYVADDGSTGRELWRTDGTSTTQVADIHTSGSANPTDLTVFDGDLYFRAEHATLGRELWRTNGSLTQLVADVNPTGSALAGLSSGKLAVLGGHLYFRADDGTDGEQLWRTDSVTTEQVADLHPSSSEGSYPSELTVFDGNLYFAASGPDGSGLELWRSDGTEAGTAQVAEINAHGNAGPIQLTVYGDHLYFSANDGTTGRELWRSDGSSAGTARVANIHAASNSNPGNLTLFDGQVYFSAIDVSAGYELWRSDGSEAGTAQVADLEPASGSVPLALTVFNDHLYFSATNLQTGAGLWRSDGASIEPVAELELDGSVATGSLALFDDALYFAADDGTTGVELWRLPEPGRLPALACGIALLGALVRRPRGLRVLSRRRVRSSALAGVVLVVLAIAGASRAGEQHALYASRPNHDPFYAQPAPFPDLPPGALLDARAIVYAPSPSGAPVPETSAWHLKFVSRDAFGKPIAAVATLLVPDQKAASPQPLVVYPYAENSLGTRCAASTATAGDGDINALEGSMYWLPALTDEHWTVLIPDHLGPNEAYFDEDRGGYITLDAIRAAVHFAPGELDGLQTPVGLWAFSGGTQSAALAAMRQPFYAPELNLVATATVGTVTDLEALYDRVKDLGERGNPLFQIYFGLVFETLIGVSRTHPGFFPPATLNELGLEVVQAVKDACNNQSTDGSGAAGSNGETLDDYLADPDTDPFDEPGALAVFDRLRLPDAAPGAPTADAFFVHAADDEIVPVEGAEALAAYWCAEGTDVLFQRMAAGTHLGSGSAAVPAVTHFLASRFDPSVEFAPPGACVCGSGNLSCPLPSP